MLMATFASNSLAGWQTYLIYLIQGDYNNVEVASGAVELLD
jgi:hypothetical protein